MTVDQCLELIKSRRSIRSFKKDPVPAELLHRIVEAGLYAASGRGFQSPVILQITNRSVRDRLMKLNAEIMGRSGTDPFYGAPAVLVVLARREIPTYLYDGSLAMGNMMLECHELGLGSCWIHRAKEEFEREEGKEILQSLGIQGDYEGIGHLAVGYIDGEYPEAAPRRDGRVFYAI